jgi:methylmalonyl-CoA mutase
VSCIHCASLEDQLTQSILKYKPSRPIRIVSASSLFDGHDAAINIMRRIMQHSGAEVIHLGHNRSVDQLVQTAVQEGADAVAITSYQGGHMEFFTYLKQRLVESGAGHIKVFGGGGGTILPEEAQELHDRGVDKIFTPDDGRELGLQGMINFILESCDQDLELGDQEILDNDLGLAAAISKIEQQDSSSSIPPSQEYAGKVLGVTGPGGAGKSTVVDELIRRFLNDFPDKKIGIISVDPSNPKSGGALLGDRIRMNAVYRKQVFMRSMATRKSNAALSGHVQKAIELLQKAGYEFIILETSGIGQSDIEILDHCHSSLYIMTPYFGAETQLEKIGMLHYADYILLNKGDKQGAQDALKAVKKQYWRNVFPDIQTPDECPVFHSVASRFADSGLTEFYRYLMEDMGFTPDNGPIQSMKKDETVIPPGRFRYLSEISEVVREYNNTADKQAELAGKIQHLIEATQELEPGETRELLVEKSQFYEAQLLPENKNLLKGWDERRDAYLNDSFVYQVRDKKISIETKLKTLSNTLISKVAVPKYSGWKDVLRWQLRENFPGFFPFTAGVFPFKREQEDPTRMFAGEGGPERTNKRFHYISKESPAKRLSTAFDSITLYGENPAKPLDVYGKIGNSGVSVPTVDDAKRLYSGFDLCSPLSSVSMTINGPAPIISAFFMNAAIDQRCEKYILEQGLQKQVREKIAKLYKERNMEVPKYRAELPEGHNGLGLMLLGVSGDQVLPQELYTQFKAEALSSVRGTVQADILKEDQAQNTCIFSVDFSLMLMADIQESFIRHGVKNFYSVSISGYHIAEAGANPISQLAFTLANGFTFVEYYLSRGMDIDDFAPNLSFFFSNGMDPEYSVIGRVARSIWAKAIKHKYGGNERSQKLKYHIQTSGRSLHSQEIDFNDMRTTLQALTALYDNCNSLHTNAYDEAISTPTEESVRRALAIQMIINKEFGNAKNQNPLQGSFFFEELTELVEEAVLAEFDRITERGGVLGAMETMYQRNRIQEESMYYERLKAVGELPIIGVNTFLGKDGSPFERPAEVIRSSDEEKQMQIAGLEAFEKFHAPEAEQALNMLEQGILGGENSFDLLLEAVKHCSLGQITERLYQVGGEYRRSM